MLTRYFIYITFLFILNYSRWRRIWCFLHFYVTRWAFRMQIGSCLYLILVEWLENGIVRKGSGNGGAGAVERSRLVKGGRFWAVEINFSFIITRRAPWRWLQQKYCYMIWFKSHSLNFLIENTSTIKSSKFVCYEYTLRKIKFFFCITYSKVYSNAFCRRL
jgi:hypothetical protein